MGNDPDSAPCPPLSHKDVSWVPLYCSLHKRSRGVNSLWERPYECCIGKNVDEIVAVLNQSLTELYAWCVRNKLTPHQKKSEYVLIHRGSFTGPRPPIYLGNNILE